MPSLGKTVGYGVRGARSSARGATRMGRWVNRRVQVIRHSGGGGEIGMIRLLDLHAASCAGDTLITMGLAGTVFFSAASGAARTNVALYLFVTMLPFALVAPVVGPVLDRFRHGRRYALAATMLGRAFLAWMISDYIHGLGLYPAAIGVLLLSRAYGVARSAAVPRLLPPSLGLSEAGARASMFGTIAGAVVAPLGAAAFWFGPQWPLRVSSVIFIIGAVFALKLPPRADSDPPETVPAIFHRGTKVLTGKLIVTLVTGGAMLRALFGFLTLFLAFAVRTHHLPAVLLGHQLAGAAALGVVAGGLGVGSFLATAIGTRLRIRRPVLLQALVTVLTTAAGLYAVIDYSLLTITLFGLVASAATGLAKLAVDATIQERVPEGVRATAFARSETAFMIAWVIGGGFGLIPLGGRLGAGIAAVAIALAAARAVMKAGSLRGEKLHGGSTQAESIQDESARDAGSRPDAEGGPGPTGPGLNGQSVGGHGMSGHGMSGPGMSGPGMSGYGVGGHGTSGHGMSGYGVGGLDGRPGRDADATVDLDARTQTMPAPPDRPRWRRMRSAKAERVRQARERAAATEQTRRAGPAADPTVKSPGPGAGPASQPGPEGRTVELPHSTRLMDDELEPGYHLYRPSGLPPTGEDD
ncbi:hypothetical protein GCM10023322_70020 [Rugosimonospora acidiphila]|uniref:MFS transporter n=1 Tax=Rugosimonospora acidiphila TaxID=556531 RepID=A0ABP9SNJ4_9ACTN